MWIRSFVLSALLATATWANEVQWHLAAPDQVAAGAPLDWAVAVTVTGDNQGLGGYAFTLALGPAPGPSAGPDGEWGTADDENLASIALPEALWAPSFRVGGSPQPATVKDLASSGGTGMNVLASDGFNNVLPGELQQVGAGYLDWAPASQAFGIGLESRKSVLLANPAGEYVLHTGSIPTSQLPAGQYVLRLIPVRARVLRSGINLQQAQQGFLLESAVSTGAAIAFTVVGGEVPADFDGDGDVDHDDLAIFLACATGPRVPYEPPPGGCVLLPSGEGRIDADFDGDGDVDQDDFARFQRCYGGSSPAVPGCAD